MSKNDSSATEERKASEFATLYHVWLTLFSVFEIVIRDAAVVSAWDEMMGDNGPATEKERFVSFLIDAVFEQLILELTRIFDTDKYKDEENCSLKMLKACCISDAEHFPNGAEDGYIIIIDSLYESYENVISKEVRNKQIAHLDLNRLFMIKSTPGFALNDILALVESTRILLNKICLCFGVAVVGLLSVDELKSNYVQLLSQLSGKDSSAL